MLSPGSFFDTLKDAGFSFFAGVPDSLLKEFCAYVDDNVPAENHVITANEGAAVALAAGYHLATGKAGLVYMQNSGTGNAINPLLSLADPAVYAIPMMLVIGWRGRPGVADEPQHVKQGEQQEALLQALGYPYEILSRQPDVAREQVESLTRRMHGLNSPVILLVKEKMFSDYPDKKTNSSGYPMSREDALKIIVENLAPHDKVVSTTGKTSRELYEIREAAGQEHSDDFLTVGSMGHTNMIALGLAKFFSGSVYCIDGDGAALMHLGSMAIIGQHGTNNLRHILINNGAHDSVGGQPTVGFSVPFSELARLFGYKLYQSVESSQKLYEALANIRSHDGPAFLEIRVNKGARKDLGRPQTKPVDNKHIMMKRLHSIQKEPE